MKYEITPVSKPRQTRSDKWKQRPCVIRYRNFADEVRAKHVTVLESGSSVVFGIPMSKSWSKKKKAFMINQPHMQKPDVDNLLKALLDAIFEDDCGIWQISIEKRWSEEGYIKIINNNT